VANKYIDVDVNPVVGELTASDGGTVTNAIRVTWDAAAVTPGQLYTALKTIADSVLNPNKIVW